MKFLGSVPDHKWILLRIGAILFAAWFVITLTSVVWPPKNMRLLVDPNDRFDYFERGQWFVQNKPAISEYPQVPTYLFGLNHLASMWFDESIQVPVYTAFFSLEMIVVLFLTMRLLLNLLPASRGMHVFFMLLPPAVFFVYNRFDILPAFLCLAAFGFASGKRWSAAAAALSFATFTKWYPILLVPGFLFYAWNQERKFQWKMVVVYTAVSVLIILATLLHGGWDALLYPYQLHKTRGMEYAALPVLLSHALQAGFGISTNNTLLFAILFALQVSGPFLTFFPKIDSLESLADYCIVAIGFFVLFSRIYSPQWLLWLLPFLILSARDRSDLLLMTIYACLCYMGYPLCFDIYGADSIQIQIAASFMLLSLSWILARRISNLIKSTWLPAVSKQSAQDPVAPAQ